MPWTTHERAFAGGLWLDDAFQNHSSAAWGDLVFLLERSLVQLSRRHIANRLIVRRSPHG